MFNEGLLQCESEWDRTLLETDIGEFAEYEGMKVPLDCPIQEEDEKNPPLNKPKKGGPKKFYVFVKDGDKIKKVTWGDTTGLRVKLNDKEARKIFCCSAQVRPTKQIKLQRWLLGVQLTSLCEVIRTIGWG